MTTLRITIEIDMDNDAVQGRWGNSVKNALLTLVRRVESTDNHPNVWPHTEFWPDGWTEQEITARLHPRVNERTVIGSFRVEQLETAAVAP